MTTHDHTAEHLDEPDGPDGGASRRTVLKRAGLATAWTVPAVQTLTMSGAWAAGSPPPPSGSGTVTGQVTNASTGQPLAGATVVADTGESTTTNGSGTYTLTDVPAGTRNITASRTSFIASTQSTTVTNGSTSTLNFALSSSVGAGAIRVVLNWGAAPNDLDLHVSGPATGGGRFHVYYANLAARDSSGDPYCQLDVDDVNGNGPETQTITVSNTEGDYVAGTYRVWVHNYSGSPNFGASGAILNLFDQTSQRGSFAQSSASGDDSKRIWLAVAFDVNDAGDVTNVNALQSMQDGDSSSVF